VLVVSKGCGERIGGKREMEGSSKMLGND